MVKTVIFDFDGTILKKNSYKLFLIFLIKKIGIFFFVYTVVIYFLKKIRIISALRAKELNLRFFIGKDIYFFDELGEEFYKKALKKWIFKDAIKSLNAKSKDYEIIVLSGAYSFYLKCFCEEFNIKNWKGTDLEFINKKFTGKLYKDEFLGKRKLEYFEKYYLPNNFKLFETYTDSLIDLPICLAAEYRYYVNANKKIKKKWSKQFTFLNWE